MYISGICSKCGKVGGGERQGGGVGGGGAVRGRWMGGWGGLQQSDVLIQTHNRLKRTLFIRTKHNMRIFRGNAL